MFSRVLFTGELKEAQLLPSDNSFEEEPKSFRGLMRCKLSFQEKTASIRINFNRLNFFLSFCPRSPPQEKCLSARPMILNIRRRNFFHLACEENSQKPSLRSSRMSFAYLPCIVFLQERVSLASI